MVEYPKWQNFKMTEEEWIALRKDARKHNMTISEYLRYCIKRERERGNNE